MNGKTWSAQITVTDHGAWKPGNERACAELIRTVNGLRRYRDARPCVRLSWWSNGAKPWLDVEIDGTSMRIDAGEHLVSTLLPDGSTTWQPLDAEDLARLRPVTR